MTEFTRLTREINRQIASSAVRRGFGVIFSFDAAIERLKQQRRDLDPVRAIAIEKQARRRHAMPRTAVPLI